MTYNFKFGALLQYSDEIIHGVLLTVNLSVITMLLGLIIGGLVAVARISPLPFVSMPARAYIEALRNTPLLVQLFIVFFGLPTIGVKLGADAAAVIALSLNVGAYSAEIFRAGIESIHRSQIESGRSLGLTAYQTFRHVVLFQAVKAIYPALASQFVLLVLATSVVSSIGAAELFHQAAFIESRIFRSFEVYALITLCYLVLTLVFRSFFAGLYWVIFMRRPRR